MKTEYLTAGGSLTNGSPRTLKSRPSESLSTKKRFFILYLGKFVCYFATINVPCSVLWNGIGEGNGEAWK